MIRALRALAAGLALGLATAASAVGPAADATVLERVVAVVRSPASREAQVLTLSRVEEEARIALVSRGAVLAATGRLDGPALKAGLDWLVDQILLDAEATRLQVFDIDPAETAAEVARFRDQFARPADYDEFLLRAELPERELESVLRRMLRVRRYVESRVSRAAQVSEAELTAWIDQHAAEIGSRDREAARAHLAHERVADEVKALVADLRARAEIRVLDDVARLAPASRGGA